MYFGAHTKIDFGLRKTLSKDIHVHHENETFISLTKRLLKQQFCRHKESQFASCPYTGRTYENCLRCGARLSVKKAENE